MRSVDHTLICRTNEIEGPIGEKRLWVAVLLQAVEDWRSDRISARRDAEKFLFHSHADFERVCAGAGIEASSFRARLCRLRLRSPMLPEIRQWAA